MTMDEDLGLYIHIPFCARKCRYCDFVSFSAAEEEMDGYVDALAREIALLREHAMLRSPRPVTSVFIGGGTPSLLRADALEKVFDAVHGSLPVAAGAEITIEANPGTLTAEKLRAYRCMGVNRLSIGVQSVHDALLYRVGRIHTASQAFEALSLAREAGFDNVNADLMRGLPGETVEQHLASLRAVAELDLSHLSVYSLIVEDGTPLYDEMEAGLETLPTPEEEYEMEQRGIELLSGYGYDRYEVSNYAKGGKTCRHNLNYWLCGEYLAAGLGASSALRGENGLVRRKNAAGMRDYLDAVARGTLPVAEEEVIDPREEMFEVVMLGLRLVDGVDLSAFSARFGVELAERFDKPVKDGFEQGMLELHNGCLRLSMRGMELQNQVLITFLED